MQEFWEVDELLGGQAKFETDEPKWMVRQANRLGALRASYGIET
jgi:hypothetical protein